MTDAPRTPGEKIIDAAIEAGATRLTAAELVAVLASERDVAIARAEAAEAALEAAGVSVLSQDAPKETK